MDEPKHKAFSEYTKVVNGLTNITDMDTAITYAKFYYEAEQSIEDNITNITKIINRTSKLKIEEDEE